MHILSIDLEDYFMVSAFDSVVKRANWDSYESRIEKNTHRILEILREFRAPGSLPSKGSDVSRVAMPSFEWGKIPASPPGVKATFFCLGWLGERYPHLIKEIWKEGHEIASHGYNHLLVYDQTPKQFREDIRKSKRILEDIIGEEVIGYRAPSYSITEDCLWAFRILAEEGYQYDSSVFPVYHDRYGIPDAPRFPFTIICNGNPENPSDSLQFDCSSLDGEISLLSILEFPLSTVRLFRINFPICGGGYFRLLPYPLVEKGLKRIHREEKQRFIFYLHPWEMDSEQPRIRGAGITSTFRHYLNLKRTERRFKTLLRAFNFSSFQEVLPDFLLRGNPLMESQQHG